MSKRLAVLLSGTGSHLSAMLDHKVPVTLVVTDRPCRAREIAEWTDIPYILLPRIFGDDFDREQYTKDMLRILREKEIGLVAMDGFKTIFSPTMFERGAYHHKILNIHPSLLPLSPGNNAVQDTLDSGVSISGFTIHWATGELDAGPSLLQGSVPVHVDDTHDTLHQRIKDRELECYHVLVRQQLNG